MQETWVWFLGWEDPLEKEMAIHSSILAWKIPWTEETGELQSMGSQESDTTEWLNHHYHHGIHKVLCWVFQLQDWTVQVRGFPGGASDNKSVCQCGRHKRCGFNPWAGKIPWSRKWQPTPVFLPGKFHGQRSLVGSSPWGHRVGHNWATWHTHTHKSTKVGVQRWMDKNISRKWIFINLNEMQMVRPSGNHRLWLGPGGGTFP